MQKFGQQGEKTGWTYITIPASLAKKLNPSNKKAFRVKGSLDQYEFHQVSLVPMGEGNYIMAINGTMRRAIRKQHGAEVVVKMEMDQAEIKAPPELMECLADEPRALERFKGLTMSHRNYFIKWITTAKTDATRARRIAATINALERAWDFGQMIRALKKDDR
ncbi:MAG: YdeI/OmpD-associated family protein [Flavisolibacter sp.]